MNFNSIKPCKYDKYTFGKCLRNRREELGFSVRKLAKLIGMSPVYLSDIERGKRNAPVNNHSKKNYMENIARYLDIKDEEINAFYDMAAVTRNRYQDIEKYLDENKYAIAALKLAIQKNVDDEFWRKIISDLLEQN